MRLVGKLSSYEKIQAYITDPDADKSSLSQKECEMLDRWMEAFTMLRNYKSNQEAASILMLRFPGISRATAYRDCAAAISLFGDISKSTKEGYRHLSTEIIRDAIAIAREKDNEEGMMKGAVAISRVNGVNINDPDIPDFAALEPHQYNIILPEGTLQLLQNMLSGGKVDLGQFVGKMAKGATDAEVEDGK